MATTSRTAEAPAIREETADLFRRVFLKLKPAPSITLSEWADNYRIISEESTNERGKWRTDRAPYQREPMDSITDIHVKKVVLMWASQMGKTDCAILNPVGYYMHYDPAPIMILQPTISMAETISKERLAPMLRDTPVLADLVKDKSRNGNNTILEKKFPGGYVVLTGANSPASLASRPIRILPADEIDRFPASAGKEGDPLYLATKRTAAFWNAKRIITSTPTIKGQSRIEVEYEHSTQGVWNVPCPACGKLQPLTWAKIKFDERAFREETNTEVLHECEHCGVVSSEYEWKRLYVNGKYIEKYPRRKTKGYYVNALACLWIEWKEIVSDFLDAVDEKKKGNVELLKSWTNTVMAETWDEDGVKIEEGDLLARLEDYGAEVPDGVIALTAGVDTQDDRFEYEVVGWGIGAESWSICKGIIYGDMKQSDIWERLDQTLLQTFEKADGSRLKITAACIDTGGHFANEVYRFCKDRIARNVWAVRGGSKGMDAPYIDNPTRKNRMKTPLFVLGVDTGKCLVYDRLALTEPGPGYCHFPADRGYDEYYFKTLTAEKKIVTYKKGRATYAWVLKDQGFKRNEGLDMRNYAQAAMEIARLPLNPKAKQRKAAQGRRQRSRGIDG